MRRTPSVVFTIVLVLSVSGVALAGANHSWDAASSGEQEVAAQGVQERLRRDDPADPEPFAPRRPVPPPIQPVSRMFERETSHSEPGRHSRYIIRDDGRFELHDVNGPETRIYAGRWRFPAGVGGLPYNERDVILLDFEEFSEVSLCGVDAIGYFLLDGYFAAAYCGTMINAGFGEGVYTTTPGIHLEPPAQGGQIAFVRDGRIFIANSDGSEATPLSDGPQDGWPAWSPDGRRIAFIRVNGTPSVHVMNADGSNVTQLSSQEHPSLKVAVSAPAWSPDAAEITFVCRSNGFDEICTMKADGGAAPIKITRDGLNVSGPSWSPDGTRIAFASEKNAYDFVSDIWVVAPDGSRLTDLRERFSLGYPRQYSPAWSPDGQRLAHVECPNWSWQLCSSVVIAVMKEDGSESNRLLATNGFVHLPWSYDAGFVHPVWSPDGQVIAFGSHRGIEWVAADGSARGLIISNGHSPSWRP